MSLNLHQIIGHVGRDPEITNLESGIKVANFSVATTKKYKNKSGEEVKSTDWHRVVCYRKLAEIVEKYVKKGSQLYVSGESHTRSYDDNQGVKRYVTEIYADTIQMLGSSSQNQDNKAKAEQQAEQFGGPITDPEIHHVNAEPADDLPF